MARILVVDDDQFMRGSLTDVLEGAGHEVVPCDGAEVALKSLAGDAFDVAITDLKMPKVSGLEFLQRAVEIDGSLPVIVITAHGTVETAVGKQYVCTKVPGNGSKPGGAWLNHHTCNLICVNDGDAQCFEMIGHRRLAATDASRDAYHKHAAKPLLPK